MEPPSIGTDYIINNIVSYMPKPWYHFGATNSETCSISTIDHNLFYQPLGVAGYAPDGAVRLSCSDEGGLAYSVSDWQTATRCPNCIEADPLFVNASSNDFHLQLGSPAIDAGTNGTEVQSIMQRYYDTFGVSIEVDFDGNPRPADYNEWDIGAFEYVA